MRKNIIIMGAAGRDFHNFNCLYKENMECRVAAFTAAQIPFIDARTYPPELSGFLYPSGIPIHPEARLAELIKSERITEVVFSYSDVSHDYVMHRASICTALGADFVLLGAEQTMLKSAKPVISVCAVRTGCGKSGVTRFIAKTLMSAGIKVAVIRHPMPYGNLVKQRVQRFETLDDIKNAECTIEEMEEYVPLIEAGISVWAGVDYKDVLFKAERDCQVIIWDGGNNDLPFIKPDLEICVADALRPGHEISYYPGEANLRRAHAVVINKTNTALPDDLDHVVSNISAANPGAKIVTTASIVSIEGGADIKGKKCLVIEDGPTLTHGGMTYGAGIIAARNAGAVPVDPAPYAAGCIKKTLDAFPKIKNLLPAVGYSKGQIHDLETTVNNTPCDIVLIATPVDLASILAINKPSVRVSYEIAETTSPGLADIVIDFAKALK
ncbi:MAG: GTPase [Deltaproteobacteria bacterium]|nr:GTPase [Deltaproteobacteria bacterium]